ncbi:MAG: STAS domain-containing protein [Methylococcales bacterium]|jgi:ABC-type transporter Mla MlaB component|nr:STAS domain-containing protein [Methylococcales bacterium]
MTTDNLIGYDPLAWMDGEQIGEKPVAPAEQVSAANETDNAPIIDSEELVDFNESDDIETEDEFEEENVVEASDEETADDSLPDVIDEASALEMSDDNDDVHTDVDIDIIIESDDDCQIDIDIQTNDDNTIDISIDTQDSPSDDDINMIDMIIQEETQIEINNIDPIVRLNSDATIKSIEELYQQFKRVLDFHDIIEVNAVEVTTIDTATLQLLVSLKKEEKRLNKTIHILSPSSRFLESARLLGLSNVLELDEV